MNLIALLSAVWILSLPFYHFSLVGSLSLDNLLAPALLVLILVRVLTGGQRFSRRQVMNVTWTLVVVFLYLMVHSLNLVGTQQAVWISIYIIAKNMVYFLLPVLLVVSERELKHLSITMVITMVVGSVSAFMSALGLISFEFARQAESRIQLDYVPKSVGLFSIYGDMALLISLAVLLALGWRKHGLMFSKTRWFTGLMIFASALLGVVAMQSRNVVFTVLVAVSVYYLLGWMRRRGGAWVLKLYASLIAGIVVAVVVVALFGEPLLDWVEGLGGTNEAAATVEARLEQYRFGWSLIENRLLIGADPAVYERNQLTLIFIHNMWLRELVQSGLLGVFTILLFYHRALATQVALLKFDVNSIARVYIAVLISSFLASQFYPGNTSIFWVIMGLATALPQRRAEPVAADVAAPPPLRVHDGLLVARRRSGGK